MHKYVILFALLTLVVASIACSSEGGDNSSGKSFDATVVKSIQEAATAIPQIVATGVPPLSPVAANAVTVLGGQPSCTSNCQDSGANGALQTK
jgi:hypothetical protein